MTKHRQQRKGSMQPFKTKCILQDAGKVSAEIAKLHAETEFEKYRIIHEEAVSSVYCLRHRAVRFSDTAMKS